MMWRHLNEMASVRILTIFFSHLFYEQFYLAASVSSQYIANKYFPLGNSYLTKIWILVLRVEFIHPFWRALFWVLFQCLCRIFKQLSTSEFSISAVSVMGTGYICGGFEQDLKWGDRICWLFLWTSVIPVCFRALTVPLQLRQGW